MNLNMYTPGVDWNKLENLHLTGQIPLTRMFTKLPFLLFVFRSRLVLERATA